MPMSSAHSPGVQGSMKSRAPLPIKPSAMASHGSTLLLPQTHGLGGAGAGGWLLMGGNPGAGPASWVWQAVFRRTPH